MINHSAALSVKKSSSKGAYFKDDRNFWGFFTLSPPSERKMMSLLLYTMTSLLLILTAFCRPPLSPRVRSSLKYHPQETDLKQHEAIHKSEGHSAVPNVTMDSKRCKSCNQKQEDLTKIYKVTRNEVISKIRCEEIEAHNSPIYN